MFKLRNRKRRKSRPQEEAAYADMTYEELLAESDRVLPGKQARALHKALRPYGDGLALLERYPHMVVIMQIGAFAIGWIAAFLLRRLVM